MRVQVVTDSTSDIPRRLADELGIRVVPIYVRFGQETLRDGVDIQTDQFYSKLASLKTHPATSQPNPEDFAAVYREYCDNEGIVSIHISSKISGTCNSARIAKKTLESRCAIEVIDSKFNSAGLGLVVLAAARKARSGASLLEVVNEANRAISRAGMFGMFETTKYLARSGRVNSTIAAASRILNIKPLLTFKDGEIVRAGLVRTVNGGLDRICSYVENNLPVEEIAIVHSAVPDRADQLRKRLSRFLKGDRFSIGELGPGLGVHGGPGVLLAAFLRSSPRVATEGA